MFFGSAISQKNMDANRDILVEIGAFFVDSGGEKVL